MPDITQKMLTQQLRELEADGVIKRIVYNQVPPKVENELSEYGWSLKGILDSLCAWGEKHITKVYGAATEEQLASIQEITASSAALVKMAEELQNIVVRFKI